jgi:kumamolisin
VSAAGDPNTGYAVVFGGEQMAVGGTSGSTPFWAGVMADMKQYLAAKGAEPTWLLDPVLYRIASAKQPFPPFHDVVRGGDRYHIAGPGWDYSTGWGTPDVYNLARDIAALARAKGLNP